MNIRLVYVTTPSHEEAEKIATCVVNEQLAACANIIDGVTSIYRWEEKLCRENETAMILKTTAAAGEKLIARIRELHSYECPCIVTLPIENGHPDFLRWIENQTTA